MARREMLAPVLMLLARPAMTQGSSSLEPLSGNTTRNRERRIAPLPQVIQDALAASEFL